MSIANAYEQEFGLTIPEWRVLAVLARYPNLSAIEVSERAAMDKVAVSRAVQSLIAAKRIVIAGFSQGGAIALQAGLRYPERLAGIMALSTYLPLRDSVKREASGANRLPSG